MNLEALIIILALAVGIAVILLILNKKIAELKKGPEDEKSLLLLQQQLNQLSESQTREVHQLADVLDRKLSEANKMSLGQSAENSKVIRNISKDSREQIGKINDQLREVTEKLVKVDEAQRQVVDYSAQLKNLQDILKNPKQRGVLGEYYLEETLKNVLPPKAYQVQYGFKNGDIVDAVVFVGEKIIPVDSKFSLETYERLLNCSEAEQREVLGKRFKQDLKNRIDETSKYVRPEEKTVDFAFMFIPSESIYYDLLVNKVGATNISSRDLIEYAFKDKHVIIVSPTSFLAYLQTVLQGLRALEIEESAKEIQKNVEKLGKHLQSYETFHEKLGNSLATTVNHYKKSHKELGKVDKDILKITKQDEVLKLEEMEIDNPKSED